MLTILNHFKSFSYHVYNKDGTHFVYKFSDATVVCARVNGW